MDTEFDPIVGNWYRHLDKGQIFRVVAFDEEHGTVEIQHFDGDIEEIDASAWFDLEIEPTEAPDDWTGPLDEIESDDLGNSDTATRPAGWRKPLEDADVEEDDWEDDEELDDERDDWAEGESSDDL